jgi:hypothetical protein
MLVCGEVNALDHLDGAETNREWYVESARLIRQEGRRRYICRPHVQRQPGWMAAGYRHGRYRHPDGGPEDLRKAVEAVEKLNWTQMDPSFRMDGNEEYGN